MRSGAPHRRLASSLLLAMAGALLLSLGVAAGAPAASASARYVDFPYWMVRSTAVSLIDAYLGNDTLADNAFDSPYTLETSAPKDWDSQSVQTYDAYGPATSPGSLLYALDNGKVPAGTEYLLYDDEDWSYTPTDEQQDPALYMSLFVETAHEKGYGAILAPSVDLTGSMPCDVAADPDWQNYLDNCQIPQIAAEAQPDVFEIQSQRMEDDTSPGSDCDCYAWFVDAAARAAEQVDPYAAVYAGLASDHEGVVSTPQNLYQDTIATEDEVDGYWLNVPQQSGACPSCTPGGAPQVAAGYLWLLGYSGQGTQTITFAAPAPATVGGETTLSATGGPSGNSVTFSVDPASTPGACSASGADGAQLSFTGTGTCVVDASQAGSADWQQGTASEQITVSPGTQTISFAPPPAGSVGGTAALSATGGPSGNPVTFSVDPASGAGVCSTSGTDGTTVAFTAAGSCVIDADQAGDADWAAAAQVTQTVSVGPGAQSIALAAPAPAAVGGTATLTATGGASGNPVVFSLDPSSGTGVCSLSGPDGATVAYTAAGTCVVDAEQAGDADYLAAPQASEAITVGPGQQSIDFPEGTGGDSHTAPPLLGTVGTTATLSAGAGASSSPVVFTVDPSSGAGVCSVSGPDGSTLSFAAVGTCVVDANQAGDANYLPAPQVSATITVGPGSQTIAFTAPASGAVGTTTTLAATGGGSTSPVVFSVDPSSDTGACSLSGPDGSTLSYTGVGSCVIDADQAADANYLAAPEVVATVEVGQGAQSIAFTPPPGAVYGTTLTLSASGGASGNPVVFSVDPATGAGVCSVSGPDGATLALGGVGSCVIDADQAGDADYQAASEVSATITVGVAGQTIDFAPPAPGTVGTAASLAATGGASGNPVVFTVDPASGAGVCSVSGPEGAVVSYTAVGTCVIDADQAGDTDYVPAPPVSVSVVVGPGAQAIAFGAPPPASVGGSGTLEASGGASGNPVVFSVDPATGAGVCSVSGPDGATVAFAAAGTCVIDANQAADADYLAAPQATTSFTVAPGTQVISFAPPAAGEVGTTAILGALGGSSGNPVVFSIDPASGAGVCSVSGGGGSALAFTGSGECVLDANEAGDADWLPAPEVVATVAVTPGSQSISFDPPASATFGTTLTLAAGGGPSGDPVVFSVDPSSTSGACNASGPDGSTLALTGAGTCVVDADQAGDADWRPAPQVRATVAVLPAAQAVTFTSTAPSGAVYGGDYAVSAGGGGSGNPVVFSSGKPAVCSVAGSTVSFVGVGTCVVDASQAGDGDFTAAPQAAQSFAVAQAGQTITFTSRPPAAAVYGGPAYTAAAAGGGSGNTVFFASGNRAVCTISKGVVSFVGVGTCVVDATQNGDADYLAAPEATQSFSVGRSPQAIAFTSKPPAKPAYKGTYTVAATGGGSGDAVVFTSAHPSICTVAGASVTFVGVGTCIVDAGQAGNSDYLPAPAVSQSFVVYKAGQAISITSKAGKPVVGGTYTVTATTGPSGEPVAFSSATPAVCTVAGQLVRFVAAGGCTIEANEGGNTDYYAAAEVRQTFTVAK